MEDSISPGLFETLGRSVHGLSSSSKGAGGQHLDLLCVSNFGASVDDFLSSLL